MQRAAQGEYHLSDDVLVVLSDLQDLALPLPADVQVWRGIRSIGTTFGAGIDELTVYRDQVARRFVSTSVHEYVIRDEFTLPGKDPAVLKVTARTGAAAVWIPPIGAADLAYQGELLFQPGCMLSIVAVDVSGDVPTIEVEVSQP